MQPCKTDQGRWAANETGGLGLGHHSDQGITGGEGQWLDDRLGRVESYKERKYRRGGRQEDGLESTGQTGERWTSSPASPLP